LDTWFSSGQWPFATLSTSKNKEDFKTFYPTDVMETGWDILFFWVARMIMLGIYCTKDVPFKTVYLHGLVRDKDRQKMSKSKGNVIDPLVIAKIYGTDAVRMALIIGNTAGSEIIISEEKIKGYRNFANKIWNASRFFLMNLEDFDGKRPILNAHDKKLLKDLEAVEKKMTSHLDSFHFSLGGELIYHYFWHTFADKIIEEMKNRIRDNKNKKQAQYVLYKILTDCLKRLHPFMPFVTEGIWQKIPLYGHKKKSLLIIEKWL
jgi:valyl-tRNA synthetase